MIATKLFIIVVVLIISSKIQHKQLPVLHMILMLVKITRGNLLSRKNLKRIHLLVVITEAGEVHQEMKKGYLTKSDLKVVVVLVLT